MLRRLTVAGEILAFFPLALFLVFLLTRPDAGVGESRTIEDVIAWQRNFDRLFAWAFGGVCLLLAVARYWIGTVNRALALLLSRNVEPSTGDMRNAESGESHGIIPLNSERRTSNSNRS